METRLSRVKSLELKLEEIQLKTEMVLQLIIGQSQYGKMLDRNCQRSRNVDKLNPLENRGNEKFNRDNLRIRVGENPLPENNISREVLHQNYPDEEAGVTQRTGQLPREVDRSAFASVSENRGGTSGLRTGGPTSVGNALIDKELHSNNFDNSVNNPEDNPLSLHEIKILFRTPSGQEKIMKKFVSDEEYLGLIGNDRDSNQVEGDINANNRANVFNPSIQYNNRLLIQSNLQQLPSLGQQENVDLNEIRSIILLPFSAIQSKTIVKRESLSVQEYERNSMDYRELDELKVGKGETLAEFTYRARFLFERMSRPPSFKKQIDQIIKIYNPRITFEILRLRINDYDDFLHFANIRNDLHDQFADREKETFVDNRVDSNCIGGKVTRENDELNKEISDDPYNDTPIDLNAIKVKIQNASSLTTNNTESSENKNTPLGNTPVPKDEVNKKYFENSKYVSKFFCYNCDGMKRISRFLTANWQEARYICRKHGRVDKNCPTVSRNWKTRKKIII